MKKVLILATAFMLFACSDDDKGVTTAPAYTGEITGEWKTDFAGSADTGEVDMACDAETPFEGNLYYRFNANLTVDVYRNCDIEGEIDAEVPFTTGTYSTNRDILTLNILGQQGKARMYDVLQYNNLVLSFTVEPQGLFNGFDIRLKKQNVN